MTPDPHFTIPVRVNLPAHVYKRLERAATAHEASISDLVAELVRRALSTAGGPQSAAVAASSGRAQYHAQKTDRAALLKEIAALHADGLVDGEIGERLGYSGTWVASLRKELGLGPNGNRGGSIAAQRALEERIRELNAAGHNDSEIARQLKVSVGNVNRRRNLLGLPARAAFGGAQHHGTEVAAR